MQLSDKPAPEFTRSFLIDLADGVTYRGGERLFETAAVVSVQWKSPVLSGKVEAAGKSFNCELNLRSTVFAVNQCNCPDGQRRKVCAHAVALALHYEALKNEQRHAANLASVQVEASADEADTPQSEPLKLRSLKLSEKGDAFRLLVFLPPNLEAAIERCAVMVKFDAAVTRQILPLNSVVPTRRYRIDSEAQIHALTLLESWCGGKLASLVQLTPPRLKYFLEILKGEPVVYWLKKPSEPIAWEDGELSGVSPLLNAVEADAGSSEEDPAVAVEENPKHKLISVNRSVREPSKPNLRRIAEAKSAGRWKSASGDFPSVEPTEDRMAKYSDRRIVVDGSPNFIAIRLPLDRDDETILPLRNLLKSEGFMLEPSNRKWWLRDRHKTLNFLAAHWSDLRDRWRAVFTENFEAKFADVQMTEMHVDVQEVDGAFTLDVSLDKGVDLGEMRRAIDSGKHYLDSADSVQPGKLVLVNRASIERLHAIERAVSGQADRPFTPHFNQRLATQELVDVEDVLEELSEGWQPPEAWLSRSRALKQVGALEAAPIRASLDAVLRTYQRIGVAWLWHLYRHHLGGILADEMGLGKTLQALALVECIQAQEVRSTRLPNLVVCPASLVENWAREASRFTPSLRVMRHHGSTRAKEAHALELYDLVITSYGTLRQDSDLLSTIDWALVLGDEAQHIKNRRTQNAKSLTRLRSEGRFLLTGTPVENSLDDLLSLFAFLMPGYLQKAAGQLTQEDRNWHNKRQTSRAAAYILRRTKREVAPELPDKIEKTFFCELGSRQSKFYQETLEKTRRDIFNLEMSGAQSGKVRFAAFTELLRLRQVCVDPRILDETMQAKDSAKLAAFDEILEECQDTGSRILVFSSFVSALKLLADHLKQNGHRFSYLDGQTRNRQAVCDEFNQDSEIPVFLISLKAGGTGLNLTGADTVIHYDPWWNPAAEAQATDRAHRIGQKRVVTSIKLIAANTVEEKVLELQARKAEILKELFEESEQANAKVSLDDIKSLLSDD